MNASMTNWPYQRLLISVVFFALWVLTIGYYQPHFSRAIGLGYAAFFVLLVAGVYWTGYRLFRAGKPFPYGYFTLATLGFGLLRWCYTYFVLQHHLPDDTVFAYPARASWFLFPTSAALLFVGYGIAQYRYLRNNPLHSQAEDAAPATFAAPAAAPILAFRSGGKEVRLPVAELIHVQANGEYLLYHCQERRYQRFQRLKEAEKELGAFGFVRIHRSYLVSRKAVRSFSTSEVELENGTVLPVSKTYRGVLGGIESTS